MIFTFRRGATKFEYVSFPPSFFWRRVSAGDVERVKCETILNGVTQLQGRQSLNKIGIRLVTIRCLWSSPYLNPVLKGNKWANSRYKSYAMWPNMTVLAVPSDAKGPSSILGHSSKKKTRELETIHVTKCAFMFFLIVQTFILIRLASSLFLKSKKQTQHLQGKVTVLFSIFLFSCHLILTFDQRVSILMFPLFPVQMSNRMPLREIPDTLRRSHRLNGVSKLLNTSTSSMPPQSKVR